MRIRLKTNRIRPHLQKVDRRLSKVAPEAHKFFVSETPIRTGKARRKTRLQGKIIKADYPYAKRLDEGWSKQSPKGMTEPTSNELDKLVGNYIKRVT